MNPVIQLLDEMTPQLLAAKVSKQKLARLRVNLEAWGDTLLHEYHSVLKDIFIHEYREVIEIYNLIPEAQWQQYEIMEMEDLREQKLLKKVRNTLRSVFNSKVFPNGKAQSDEEATTEDLERISVRS